PLPMPRPPPRPTLFPYTPLFRSDRCATRHATFKSEFGPASNLHDLFFFLRERLVDLGDVFVGELLDLLLRAPIVILRHELLLQQVLEIVHDVAAHVADGNARILSLVPNDLRKVAAPFL